LSNVGGCRLGADGKLDEKCGVEEDDVTVALAELDPVLYRRELLCNGNLLLLAAMVKAESSGLLLVSLSKTYGWSSGMDGSYFTSTPLYVLCLI
jgi:hypothetical protein